jgi:hypothetical protein
MKVMSQRGLALLHVLILLTVLMAMAEGAALVSRVEVRVSYFHRNERDAAYGARAMLAGALQELERVADWDTVLSGFRVAAFVDGPPDLPRRIPGAGTVSVCCDRRSMTGRARAESGQAWQLFAWQSLSGLLDIEDTPRHYMAAWVLDDLDEADGNPLADSNDRIVIRVESVAALGVRHTIEALVARASADRSTGVRRPGLQLLRLRAVR